MSCKLTVLITVYNGGVFLPTDPPFGWDEFKWSVADPSKLIKTIRGIEGLSETEFLVRQKKGREYAAAYLKPVTADGLRVFLET